MLTNEQDEMVTIATTFFKSLFTTGHKAQDTSHIFPEVDLCISNRDNSMLLVPFTEEEVYEAIKVMGPTKAPRFDGFSVIFY